MDPNSQIFLEVEKLEKKVNETTLPPELKEKLSDELRRLTQTAHAGSYPQMYEQVAHYVEWVTRLPWTKRSEDILDLDYARKVLDRNHYGLDQIKERVLEYLSVMKLRKEKNLSTTDFATNKEALKFMRAPILCLVGLVGTGKTTIAYSIAEAMGRRFVRIPFGGIGDSLYLRGRSRVYPESEPGQVIKAMVKAGTKNPVILLDEMDRVDEQSRSTIMGVLVELLDPEQNNAFNDHFIDYPFDLSEALFIATCNNTTNISTAVMDRLEPLQMPSYTDEEKISIGRNFVLPRMMEEAGLNKDDFILSEEVWPKIVRPLGYDAGIRTLERTINGICRKVAKLKIEKKGTKFQITASNVKDFLPNW
ncbi:MAG: AAA family ATPase [bacterium]|nr:AAA family ATPase [bacterium]